MKLLPASLALLALMAPVLLTWALVVLHRLLRHLPAISPLRYNGGNENLLMAKQTNREAMLGVAVEQTWEGGTSDADV